MVSPVRADALPEFHQYADEGCEHYPRCLTCPLGRCRYDVKGGIRVLHNAHRDPAIVHDYRRLGLPVFDIAHRYGVSMRTVWRIVAGARSDPP